MSYLSNGPESIVSTAHDLCRTNKHHAKIVFSSEPGLAVIHSNATFAGKDVCNPSDYEVDVLQETYIDEYDPNEKLSDGHLIKASVLTWVYWIWRSVTEMLSMGVSKADYRIEWDAEIGGDMPWQMLEEIFQFLPFGEYRESLNFVATLQEGQYKRIRYFVNENGEMDTLEQEIQFSQTE
jgi:hypothetical protein